MKKKQFCCVQPAMMYSLFQAKGVDIIVCLSVNDAFVMSAWGAEHKTEGKVRMLADTKGDFTKV
jgi:2-Cys peroxiredoxin 5